MKAKLLLFVRYTIGGVGLYLGLAQAHSDIANAVAIATLMAVGIVGILSFVSHVLLNQQDAKQIGFAAKESSFQYEVGFANLAIGVAAVISYCANWGIRANATLLFVYSLYFLQAGILHVYTAVISNKRRAANLKRAIPTFIFSAALYYLFYLAISSGQF